MVFTFFSLHFLIVYFALQKLLHLLQFHLFIFASVVFALGDRAKSILLICMSKSVLCMFSSRSFMVSGGGLVTMSCDPIDCSLPGSSVHGILQARILEWIAISLSRLSSQRSNQTQVSCLAGRFFTDWATREAQVSSLVFRSLIRFELFSYMVCENIPILFFYMSCPVFSAPFAGHTVFSTLCIFYCIVGD